MSHESSLISTLALSLIAALIGALVAARLRLPPLVGYLLGGVLIGPFASRLVPSTLLAQEIAEVGVIQLMFGVGLHFSIRELLTMPTLAVAGAVLQMAVATCLGTAYSTRFSTQRRIRLPARSIIAQSSDVCVEPNGGTYSGSFRPGMGNLNSALSLCDR